jgi:N-acetylneuraminic acid mutarotase
MNLNKSLTPAKIVLCGAFVLVGLISQSSISLAQDKPWTTKAPMPTARFWYSCEVVNGKIYVFGGATTNNSPALASVEEYDPVTDTWTTKTPMPTPRYLTASAVVDGKIYIIGGDSIFILGWCDVLHTMEVYDPSNDTWDTQKTPMPTGRYAASACVVNGVIYVMGGVYMLPGDDVGRLLNVVEAYDPATDTWTTKAPMPTARYALSMPVVNGKIYAMGGSVGGGYGINTVELYDPETDTWTMKASMPIVNCYFGTCIVDGIIYTIGGWDYSQHSRVFTYDPEIDEWSELSTMPTARLGLGAGIVNGKIYAIGGAPHSTMPPLSINEEYDPHLDLLPLIEKIEVDKSYAKPGTDSVCITTKISDPTGITIMVHIEAPDKSPVDSMQLFDDGNHNDGNAGDSLYANVWPVSSAEEQQYYVDLKVTRVDMDTVINYLNDMATITTIGPVEIESYTFTGDDTIPNPGDIVKLKITLRNDGSTDTATYIKAKLISLDPLVTIPGNTRFFGDIAAGENATSSSIYSITIDEEWPGNTSISIMAEITSDDYIFWRDTFSIMVEEPVNIDNIIEPISRIYPNPSTDHVFIDFNQPLQGETLIEVLEYTGKPVLMDRIYGNNLSVYDMDISALKSGIYILRIINENTCVYKKIIKSL